MKTIEIQSKHNQNAFLAFLLQRISCFFYSHKGCCLRPCIALLLTWLLMKVEDIILFGWKTLFHSFVTIEYWLINEYCMLDMYQNFCFRNPASASALAGFEVINSARTRQGLENWNPVHSPKYCSSLCILWETSGTKVVNNTQHRPTHVRKKPTFVYTI